MPHHFRVKPIELFVKHFLKHFLYEIKIKTKTKIIFV